MVFKSTFPDVAIPDCDMWSFIFDSERDFPDTQIIYRDGDDPDRRYTFNGVRLAATVFGEGLRHHFDWQKGDVLAIYAANDVDFAPVIFGVFYAGGIVCPANSAYTSDELSYQLRNSGAKALVTTTDLLPKATVAAKQSGIPEDRILILGSLESSSFRHWFNIHRDSGSPRISRCKLNPDTDLAFLVYSSGTTGLPKGVMLSHRNVVSDLCLIRGAVGRWYKPGADRMLGIIPFFHIYGLIGLIHQCLYRGIEMVVMRAYTFERFLRLVQQFKITFIYVAPPVIVRMAHDDLVNKYDLSSVRMITSGAAPLTVELITRVHNRLGIPINQAYGLSETSPMTHTQPWDEWETSAGSVGKMFPNMIGKFVSSEGEVEPGAVGELWLAGPNVFKGYWKNDEATKLAIVEEDGLRYLRTGDIGFQDKNHNFFITDRVKDMIKYKGFQVAPTELEGKLSDHPLVRDVAVIGVYDRSQHTEVPRAYIMHASRGGQGANEETGVPEDELSREHADVIIKWFEAKVANHKRLRGGVRFVEAIPKSAAGKVLKNQIKQMAKREEALQKSARL
ncbi:AMP-binding enzyme domain-containing protein [Cladophialophora immunda]|nr:AMP-binding enzyme domain-containing protein [Cladophialophora immunda]